MDAERCCVMDAERCCVMDAECCCVMDAEYCCVSRMAKKVICFKISFVLQSPVLSIEGYV